MEKEKVKSFLEYLIHTLLTVTIFSLIAGYLLSIFSDEVSTKTGLVFMSITGPFIATISVVKNFKKFMNPVMNLSKDIQLMASGDLSFSIISSGKGEIGKLQDSIIALQEKLRLTVADLRDNAVVLAEVSEEQFSQTRSMKENIDVVVQQSNDIHKLITESVRVIDDVNQGSHDINRGVSNLKESMNKINDGINRVTIECEKENVLASDAKKNSYLTQKAIEEMVKESELISQALNDIMSISQETDLLAINAAVEAASAGAAGKGFAVVAGEVKKLAEKSRDKTEHIDTIISDMQEKISAVKNATESTIKSVDEVSKASNSILKDLEEQRKEVVNNNNFVESSSTALGSIAQEIDAVSHNMNSINTHIEDISSNINDVSNETDSIYSSAESIENTAVQLNEDVSFFSI